MMQTEIRYIRPAAERDAGRIAEIIVTNYRTNFYPFFRNDAYYFDELNVLDTVKEYAQSSEGLRNSAVYDDGIVKGVIRIPVRKLKSCTWNRSFRARASVQFCCNTPFRNGTPCLFGYWNTTPVALPFIREMVSS